MRPALTPMADHRRAQPLGPFTGAAAARRIVLVSGRLRRWILAGLLAVVGVSVSAPPASAQNADRFGTPHPAERRSLTSQTDATPPRTPKAGKAGAADPGIRLEIDRQNFRVVAVDLASGELGPSVPVAIGSPDYPTPTGQYRLWQIVRDPAWTPGPTAREFGADPVAPSPDGPLGVAKIPFEGAYALHGGANRYSVGKPITLGCLRGLDADLSALMDWLETRSALGPIGSADGGERPQPFIRPARLIIR